MLLRTFSLGLVLSLPTLALAGGGALTVTDGWVRETPPGLAMTGGYLTLHNDSARAVTVVGIDAKGVADRCELHVSEASAEGTSSMRHLAQLVVPAHGQVEMRPGGTHIMLMNLKRPLTRGVPVKVTLRFQDGSPLESTLAVRAP